jgi:DNA-binding NarL/FixJ family response regulator
MIKHFLRGAAEYSTSSVNRLTDRELEVFELVGRGKTTSQISSDLNLTSKTVETYRGRIKVKLGLSNATELHQAALQWILENNN